MEYTLYIASDHAGFALKQVLKKSLESQYRVVDCGPESVQPGDDYPDYAQKVCQAVLSDKGARGVLICDTGVGMSIAANRYKGLRAALVTSPFLAERSRQHNDANILCLGQDVVSQNENIALARLWLETPFSGEERHVRRLTKLDMLS